VCMYVYLSLYIHIEIYINTFELWKQKTLIFSTSGS
jgi:hypothetical protein